MAIPNLLNLIIEQQKSNTPKSPLKNFNTVPYFFAFCDKRAKAASSIDYEFVNELKLENDFDYKDMVMRTVLSYLLNGAGYWLLITNNFGFIKKIRWLNPFSIKYDANTDKYTRTIKNGTQQTYKKTDDGRYVEVSEPVLELCPFNYFGLQEIGPGSIPAALPAEDAGAIEAIAKGLFNQYENGTWPQTVATDEDQPLDEDNRNRLKSFLNRLLNGTNKAGQTMVLNSGMKFHDIAAPNLQTMDLIANERQRIENIGAALATPAAILDGKEIQFSTLERLQFEWFTNVVVVDADLIAETANKKVFDRLNTKVVLMPDSHMYMNYLENVRAERFLKLVQGGINPLVAAETVGIQLPENVRAERIEEQAEDNNTDEADTTKEMRSLRNWINNRLDRDDYPQANKFKTSVFNIDEIAEVIAEEAAKRGMFRHEQKAVDSLDDPNKKQQLKLEKKATNEIEAALKQQLKKSVPAGATNSEILAASQQLAENGTELQAALSDMIAASSLLGVETAAEQFATIGMGFDLSFVNQKVLDTLLTEGTALFGQINGTSNDKLQKALQVWQANGKDLQDLAVAIANWVETGEPLPTLVNTLGTTFGRSRGAMVGVTEVTRFTALANEQAYMEVQEETGLTVMKRWVTANDERVCPICAPLGGLLFGAGEAEPATAERQKGKGQTASLGDPFVHPGGRGAANDFKGKDYMLPPAHVYCRCDVVPVVSGFKFKDISKTFNLMTMMKKTKGHHEYKKADMNRFKNSIRVMLEVTGGVMDGESLKRWLKWT